MSIDARLDRLYPGLSARERAVLVLRAYKEDRDPDPQVRRTIPDPQVDVYNRLIDLLQGTSSTLTPFIMVVQQLVEQLSLRWCWLASLHMSALNASGLVATALAAVSERKERTALRRALRPRMARFALSVVGDPDWAGAEDDLKLRMTGDVLAAGLIDGMREAWPQRWREVRAAEVVAGEVAHELGGEDPLDPEVRALLDTCRAHLLDLQERIAPYTGPLAPEEPDEELLGRLRQLVHGDSDR